MIHNDAKLLTTRAFGCKDDEIEFHGILLLYSSLKYFSFLFFFNLFIKNIFIFPPIIIIGSLNTPLFFSSFTLRIVRVYPFKFQFYSILSNLSLNMIFISFLISIIGSLNNPLFLFFFYIKNCFL